MNFANMIFGSIRRNIVHDGLRNLYSLHGDRRLYYDWLRCRYRYSGRSFFRYG